MNWLCGLRFPFSAATVISVTCRSIHPLLSRLLDEKTDPSGTPGDLHTDRGRMNQQSVVSYSNLQWGHARLPDSKPEHFLETGVACCNLNYCRLHADSSITLSSVELSIQGCLGFCLLCGATHLRPQRIDLARRASPWFGSGLWQGCCLPPLLEQALD